MKPKSVPTDGLLLFQAHFDQQLNLDHPLIKLANQIDWNTFDRKFGEHYCEDNGAPACTGYRPARALRRGNRRVHRGEPMPADQ